MLLLILSTLLLVYPEGDPMSTTRAMNRLPLIEQVAYDEEVPVQFDPITAAATAIVESGAGRNERRTQTVRRRTKANAKKRYVFRGVPAQYCGELQMGHMAGLDVGFESIPMYRRGPDGEKYRVSWDTTRDLLGNPELAYRMYMRYMVRYQRWHAWEPRWMAFIWKAGPGSAKAARRLEAKQPDLDLLVVFDRAARAAGITRARVYVERFDREYARLDRARAEQNWSEGVDALARIGEALIPLPLRRFLG